jgi:hypothetical protein
MVVENGIRMSEGITSKQYLSHCTGISDNGVNDVQSTITRKVRSSLIALDNV